MNRAIDFYENLFDQPVTKKDEILSVFDIHGFRLCLFNNEKVNDKVVYGDNCLLSIEVDNMDRLMAKLKKLNVFIVFPLARIGDNMVLEFQDSEGNDMEVYCQVSDSSG